MTGVDEHGEPLGAGKWIRLDTGRWIHADDLRESVSLKVERLRVMARKPAPVVVGSDGYIVLGESPAIPQHPGEFFDRWSALHRPGAWEWSTAWGFSVRGQLADDGWIHGADVRCPWRVVWSR